MDCFRQILRNDLNHKQKKNKKYTLSQFAKDLDLSKGFVSALLSGKKSLSEESALKICSKMNWTQLEKKKFYLSLQYAKCSSKNMRQKIEFEYKTLNTPFNPKMDQKSKILNRLANSWYHFAILKSLSHGICEQRIPYLLGLPSYICETAIERLVQLKFLKRDHNKKLIPSFEKEGCVLTHLSGIKANLNALENAQKYLNKKRNMESEFALTYVVMSKDDLEEFKKKLHLLLKETSMSKSCSSNSEIYQISVQAFNLKPN